MPTSEQFRDVICCEAGTADKIQPAVIAELIVLKMVELNAASLPPALSLHGEKCFTVLESGDGVAPELDDMAAREEQ